MGESDGWMQPMTILAKNAYCSIAEPAQWKLGSEACAEFLCGYIGTKLDISGLTIEEQKLLSGGAIQENWLIRASTNQDGRQKMFNWVLRRDSASSVSVSMSRAEEFAVLLAAYSQGVKVPEPLLLCVDKTVLGRDFFVMQALRGTASGRNLSTSKELDAHGATLAAQLGANLGRLHSIKPPIPDLSFLSAPVADPALANVHTYRKYLDTCPQAYPVLEWGLYWLERNAPAPLGNCLIHRDFRTGNYMVHDGVLQGVLDWEFTGWGDPREDIGWFTAKCWRFARPDLEAGGISSLKDFLRSYEQTSGISVDAEQLLYWQVMAHVRWAVIALQQAQRHASGEQRSLELALTGRLVPGLELEILHLTGGKR